MSAPPCYLDFGTALLRYTPAINAVVKDGSTLTVHWDNQLPQDIHQLGYDEAAKVLKKLPAEFERCIWVSTPTELGCKVSFLSK